jgi:hypothetical protein
MNAPAHSLRQKAAPKPSPEPMRRAASTAPSPAPAASATPRYLRASIKLGGVNDPEEHEAEHAASVIASGGCYQVRDPGGSTHLRAAGAAAAPPHEPVRKAHAEAAAHEPVRKLGAEGAVHEPIRTMGAKDSSHEPIRKLGAEGAAHMPIRAAVAPPVLDIGASGRVRRAVAPAILDPGASGRVRSAAGPAPAGPSRDAGKEIERARAAATRPLPPAVQARLERGFGERMDNVALHSGPSARRAARAIGARAYTEGERITLGPGESEHDVRLLAHEATHVVQNRRAAGVFRALPADHAARRAPQGEINKTEVRKAEASEIEIHRTEARRLETSQSQPIRRFGLDTILDKFADWANVIPGFRIFTIVLGMNPINGAHVDRSGANILRGAVELIPFGGLIVKALETYGIFEKGGAWVDEQTASLGMVGGAIRDALMDFLDSLGLSDVFHPGDVWDRAKRIFTEPIDRLIAFFKAVGAGIIELIKEAILKPLAALASKTKAWDLLVAVLGHNPITNEPVEPSPELLIGGMMKLAGQGDVWESIQKANALQRVWAWFKKAIGELLGFVQEVPGLFVAAIKSFVIQDLLDLPGAFLRVAGMFASFVGKFISWGLNAAWNLLEIVFDVVSPQALGYIKKTGAALKKILKNPLPFVGNLVKAAKLGLQNFADNIGTHLKTGLIEWLTGALTGVYLPKALSLAEIGKFALSVLGLAWTQIRSKIVKALGPTGETIMKGLEKAADFIVALVTGGPAAVWELIKEKLSELKDTVIDGIKGFVESSIIKVAIPKLVAMFIPGAGFISAIVSIYGTIKSFMEQLGRIAAAVAAFIDSIIAIAEGQIAGAAKKVESALAGVISIAIGLLAGFLGLGGISDKVMAVVKKVQAAVDKALDAAIAWIIGKAKALFGKLFGGKDKDGKRDGAPDSRLTDASLSEQFSMGSEGHTMKAELRGGELNVTIASTEAVLVSALRSAIDAESGDTGRPDSQRRKILLELNVALSQAQSLREDWIAVEAQDPAGGNKKVTYEKFMTSKLHSIVASLRGLEKYNITDIQKIIAKPTNRFIPKGIKIRPILYDQATGGQWKTESKKFRDKYKSKLSAWVYEVANMRSTDPAKAKSEWNHLIDSKLIDATRVPTFDSYEHAKHFPPLEYETDHRKSLGEFWNAGENNKDDATRAASALDQSNWQLLTEKENNLKSGVEFSREVGPDFTSSVANSPAGSNTINGQPFLDAPP